MSKLVNMELDATEAKELSSPAYDAKNQPAYPYGLCLRLDNDSLEKLKLETPEVGDTVMVTARALVSSVSSYETIVGGLNRNLELQITDLAVTPGKADRDATDTLYEKKGRKAE